MNTQRTTVQINPKLLYEARFRALQEKVSLKDIIEKSLANYLAPPAKEINKKVKIGGHNLGGIKGKIKREGIYDYL